MDFNKPFPGGQKVRAGAAISCVIGGIDYTATIYRDEDAGAPDENNEGFWPSRDRSAPGWIGDNPAKSFEVQQAECEAVMAHYKAGKMVYCTLVVTAKKAHLTLVPRYEAAVWSLDINWPHGDNGYLLEVANELLGEARPKAEAALARAIESAERGLAALKA